MKLLLSPILLSTILSAPMLSMGQANPKASSQNKSQTQVDLNAKTAGWLNKDKTAFVENKGQLRDQNGKPNTSVKYLLNMPGLNVQLRPTGFSYDTWIEKKARNNNSKNEAEAVPFTRKFHRVDIELEGANPGVVMTATQPLTEVANVINEHGSFEYIRSFGKVVYQNIYTGIDLEFVARKGTDKPIEYNFIIHSGADASQIRMKYNGQNNICLKQGNIEMMLNHGKLSEHIPASWLAGSGKQLAVQYAAKDRNVYSFHIPAYNKKETLIIDPTPNLEWATYYGGSDYDQIAGVATDSQGNIYVAGFTASTTNIASAGAYDGTYGGGVTGITPNADAFIAKFSTNGQRVWGTYYGGALRDSATAIAIKGNVVIIGGTTSSAAMATAGAHQTTQTSANNSTGFLAKFDATTGMRTWGTYYGGSMPFQPTRIAVDAQDNFFVYGAFKTNSTAPVGVDVATAGTFRPTLTAGNIVINQFQTALVKFNSAGVRQWGTYIDLSRITPTSIANSGALALDADGQPYVCGGTTSTDIWANTTEGQTYAGGGDGIILKIDKTNGQRTWGRYFGGASSDYIHDIYIDKASQSIYATGNTKSTSGISTPGTFRENVAAGLPTAGILFRAGFLASFDLNGVQKMGTYLNLQTLTGSAATIGASIAEDNLGNIIVYGNTNDPAPGITTNCSYAPNAFGGNDVFVNSFTPQGQRIWGTYIGTTGTDGPFGNGSVADARGKSVTTDPQGNIILVYNTAAAGAAANGAFQATHGGGTFDGVIAKLNTGLVPSDVKVTASTLNPMNQTTCALGIPAIITGNAISLYNPPGFNSPIFYQWQVSDAATGPWTDLPGEVFKDLQPLASSTAKYYRRLILLNNGFCDKKIVDSSAAAEVLVNGNISPIANADGPQWYVCNSPNNTVTLNGSATGGSGVYSSYQWYAGSNLTTPVANTASYTPTITEATTYTLKVTDNAGCVDVDQVTAIPAIANAGPDANMCENSGGVQIGTTGIAGGAVSYSWSTVSGSPVATSLSCTNCAQPVANPTVTTTYRLTTVVTRKGGTTCSTTDDVVITFVAAPTGGATFGGTDKTICKSGTVVLGGVNDAAATYSWSPVSYLSASNIYNPTFNAGTNTVKCPMVYTVTATKSGCTFTDQVNVNVIDPSTGMDNQTVACQAWASGNTNNCSGATYSWQLVSGPGVVPTGDRLRNGGADAYLTNTGAVNAVYRRVTTVNGVNCNSGIITISPCGGGGGCPVISIQTISPQGCPKVFGQQELQLYVNGINAADYNFSWTPANIMSDPNAPVVIITTTAPATINVSVTNKYTGEVCTAPALPINNPSWSLPVINLTDKATCPSTPVAIGEPAAAGYSYLWSPPAGLNSSTVANPVASIAATSSYYVTKTDDGSGCKARDTVTVTVRSIDFDAGNDRAVCNGATVRLGTTPGGSYTYSWTPIGAAWTNGTGPTDAQPQVLFAGSTQTFNVTITDPLTGCQKTDAFTLTGTVLAGEYAGTAPASPYCPGETVQLGRAAEPDATYSWSPATGLSCTTCANPVATVGTTSQAYTVQVSYPGCSTPASDNVTVGVKSMPAVILTNKSICPSTPVNIGIGGTGNTASLPEAVGYQWSPATGLSCTSCASPNANPVAVTTYKVIITLNNGCTLEREVIATPIVTATAKPDATICPGGNVVLGSPAVANVTYSWSVLSGTAGSITPTNAAQPTANPTATSVYRLTATGTGPNAGCTVTDDVQVTVKTLPAFNIAGNTSICSGGTASLAVTPVTPNVIYQWSPLTGVVSPDSSATDIIPVATTTYRVTQTDLNSGCSDYKEAIVTVWPNNVSADGGNITVCPASSAMMPLTVAPASGNTIVWSPATYLSNPFAQNPTVTPQSGGNYIATVTNNTTNCKDTALVIVTVPASCLSSDFGDAPLVYEKGDPASHGISALLKIGASTDAEGGPIPNNLATGDDTNGQVNDEEGISFLPAPSTASRSLGLIVNNVLNNTGTTAWIVAWIDFNRDGDFDDTGERSQVISLATSSSGANPVLQFSGFNTGCVVSAGRSYLRVRLTTDNSGGWNTSPSPNGDRVDGEVEDYAIVITGNDFGDASAVYPVAKAVVNPDLNSDGHPDNAGSVWLGTIVDYQDCEFVSSTLANSDDQNGTDDEDGFNTNGTISPNATRSWDVIVNSQGPVTGVQWGMWIDWNADGVFDDFYNGNVNTASPVTVPVSVTAAANMVSHYIVRLGVKTGTAFTSTDYNYPVTNGEWEDYIGPQTTLSVTLLSFTATEVNHTALLKWETATEENSDYFVVERRSGSVLNWEEIGRINAAGNSSENLSYSLTDPLPLQGLNYYRLKIVDIDGSYELSEIRRLDFGEDGNRVAIFPNPAKNSATLILSKTPQSNVTVKVWNNLGQIIQTYNLTGSRQTYNLNVMGIAQGIYHVTVNGEGINENIKLMIQ